MVMVVVQEKAALSSPSLLRSRAYDLPPQLSCQAKNHASASGADHIMTISAFRNAGSRRHVKKIALDG